MEKRDEKKKKKKKHDIEILQSNYIDKAVRLVRSQWEKKNEEEDHHKAEFDRNL